MTHGYTVKLGHLFNDAGVEASVSSSLDPMKLIATRALVCANSGGGKSWLIRHIVEQTLRTIPTIILDREGEFATLRQKFDVVLVGQGGEVACAVATAAKLARRLIELRLSAVVDLSDLAMGDKRRFVRLFLEALIALPRALWHPTLIVIDEAHQFAPESGREAESLAAVVALMDQGRKRGFGAILATQRLAKLHKDAAAEANNLFVGRFAQDVDLKRAGELLGFAGREGRAEIRNADPGVFYALGPALADPGVVRFRCGPVLTTHPDPQNRHTVTPPQPSKRILAVAGELADLEQQVKAETNELEALRTKVREQATAIAMLERKGKVVAVAPPAAATKAQIDAMVEAARQVGLAEGKKRAVLSLQPAIENLRRRFNELDSEQHEEHKRMRFSVATAPRTDGGHVLSPARQPRQAAKIIRADADSAVGNGGTRKMMAALATHGPLTRSALGLFAGLKSTTGSFKNNLGTMRRNGWGEDLPDGQFAITDAGIAALGEFESLPSGRELLAWWERWCGGSTARMFAELCKAGRSGMMREALGAATGLQHTTGSFKNNLGRMRGAGIMVDVDRGRVALSPTLLGCL